MDYSENYVSDTVYTPELSDFSISTLPNFIIPTITYDQFSRHDEEKDKIAFHIPHKKLLEQIKSKSAIPEPLTGFSAHQNAIRKKVIKPFIEESKNIISTINARKSHEKRFNHTVTISGTFKKHWKNDELKNDVTIIDQLKLIKKLRSDPKEGFYYLIFAVERSSQLFTPYAFKVVPYEEIGKSYMTISINGVTKYSVDEVTFTPLQQWEEEYKLYLKLMQIKLFALFPLWKAFYVWRKTIINKKIRKMKHYLLRNLFVINPALRSALLHINSTCASFLQYSMVDLKTIEKLHLSQFAETQFAKLKEIRKELEKFRNHCTDIVNSACTNTLTVDDNANSYCNGSEKLTQQSIMLKERVWKTSYMDQALKEQKFYRLYCFIRLIDYILANMTHGLLCSTYTELLTVLKEHTKFIPPISAFDDHQWDLVLESKHSLTSRIQLPCFVVDVIISSDNKIIMDPSSEMFMHVFTEIQQEWERNLKEIKPLIHDTLFQQFTRPTVYNKNENNIHKNLLQTTISNGDSDLEIWKEQIVNIIKTNVEAVTKYCERFSNIQSLYIEIINSDENVMRNNESCNLLRKWCSQYWEAEIKIQSIVEYQPIGIFHLQLQRLKTALLSIIYQKQQILTAVIPELARKKVSFLLTEIINSVSYLETDPISTEAYAVYIKFLEDAQQKFANMKEQLNYIQELFDIAKEYNIAVTAEDTANYANVETRYTNFISLVNAKLEEKDDFTSKFNFYSDEDDDVEFTEDNLNPDTTH